MRLKLHRMLACLLCTVLMLTAAPMSGLAGLDLHLPDLSALFATKAKAETVEDETSIHGTVGTKLTWNIDKETGVLTVTCPGDMPDFSATDAPWKQYSQYIDSLILVNGCTLIGSSAFSGLNDVVSVTMPDSVTSIGTYAFSYCHSLTSITIPDSVTSIGDYAFYWCSGLESITIPDSVTSIGTYAISYCHSLTSITIPDGITSIGYSAFYYCTGLTSVTIPGSVTRIYDYAFVGCTGLTSVTIPYGVYSLTSFQFNGCSALAEIQIYNRNCQLSQNALPITATLYGFTGSTTESFANTYGYAFVALDDIHQHTYSGACDETCNLCGETRTTAHNLGDFETIAEPTCSEPGYAEAVCADCGKTVTKELVALDHLYGDWETVTAPACNRNGEKVSVCSRCGETIWESIPKTDHSFSDWTVDQAATCDHAGYEIRTCALCDAVESRSIEPLTHTDSDGDGICDICHHSVSAQYVAAGQCGPHAYWKLDSEGNLEIYGSGVTLDLDENSATTRESTTAAPTTAAPTTTAPTYPYEPEPRTRDGNNRETTWYYGFTTTEPADPLTTTQAPETTTAQRSVSIQPVTAQRVGVDPPADPITTIAAPTTRVAPTVPDDPLAPSIPWSDFQERIRTVTIAPGITGIGSRAFAGCTALTSVSLPSTLVVIGSSAFSGCTSLEDLTLPKHLSSVGYRAFAGCTALKTLHYQAIQCTFSRGSWYQDSDPFEGCTQLTTLYLGENVASLPQISTIRTVIVEDGVTRIASGLFSGWSQITTLTLPDSLERIEPNAFRYCSGLTTLALPENLSFIGDHSFAECSSLVSLNYNCVNCLTNGYRFWDWDEKTSTEHYFGTIFYKTNIRFVMIGSSVESIPSALLCGATSLTTVEFPASVKTIGAYAFCYCTALTTLTLPEGIVALGDCAFGNCTALNALNYNCIDCAVSYSYSYAPFSGCDRLSAVTLGSRVAVIPYAFLYGKKEVRTLTIPQSVRKISDYAFFNSGLTEITIPDGVTFLGSSAFAYCTALTSLTIPESVAYIGYNTFEQMTGLQTLNYNAVNAQKGEEWYSDVFRGAGSAEGFSVVFGNRVETILKGMFYDNAALRAVTIPASVTVIPESAFYGTGLQTVTLPGSIQTIERNAFGYCASLTSINIPDNVTSIWEGAFSGCTELTSIAIPGCVKNICDSAFSGCTGLTNLSIGNGVERIGNSAFRYCSEMTSIEIPESVKNIGSLAFCDCNNLRTVYYNAVSCDFFDVYSTPSNWIPNTVSEVVLGNHVQRISSFSFWNCTQITQITIPSSVISIESSAFSGCASLTSLTIPDSVTSIGSSAFSGCTGLTNVTIGKGVKSIGNYAFSGCTGLKSIQYNATACETIGSRNSEAFMRCTGVETVTIGDNVTSIPAYAFTGCDGLKKIVIPDTAIAIHPAAFAECYGAAIYCKSGTYAHQYALQNQMEYVLQDDPNAAFTIKNDVLIAYHGTAKNVVVPAGVKAIGVRAFAGNNAVESVELPYSTASVFDSAFSDCAKLRRVILPFTVTGIHADAIPGGVTVVCCNGSYAHTFAQTHGIPFELITVSFGGAKQQIEQGNSLQLAPAFSVPLAYGLPLTYTVDDPSVASVAADGTVTANRIGTTTVTASAFNDAALGAVEIEVVSQIIAPTVSIDHFRKQLDVDYKTTVTFTADLSGAPAGATAHWFIDGKDVHTGATCTVKQATKDYTVQVKLIGADGAVLAESEVETVKVNTGFFAKLIAFFKGLFGALPVIIQHAYYEA